MTCRVLGSRYRSIHQADKKLAILKQNGQIIPYALGWSLDMPTRAADAESEFGFKLQLKNGIQIWNHNGNEIH
ncbi:MAG: hypothetical protein R3E08_10165 [Thiotrichaceae bacterium]